MKPDRFLVFIIVAVMALLFGAYLYVAISIFFFGGCAHSDIEVATDYIRVFGRFTNTVQEVACAPDPGTGASLAEDACRILEAEGDMVSESTCIKIRNYCKLDNISRRMVKELAAMINETLSRTPDKGEVMPME